MSTNEYEVVVISAVKSFETPQQHTEPVFPQFSCGFSELEEAFVDLGYKNEAELQVTCCEDADAAGEIGIKIEDAVDDFFREIEMSQDVREAVNAIALNGGFIGEDVEVAPVILDELVRLGIVRKVVFALPDSSTQGYAILMPRLTRAIFTSSYLKNREIRYHRLAEKQDVDNAKLSCTLGVESGEVAGDTMTAAAIVSFLNSIDFVVNEDEKQNAIDTVERNEEYIMQYISSQRPVNYELARATYLIRKLLWREVTMKSFFPD